MNFKKNKLARGNESRPGIVSRWSRWLAPALFSLGLGIGAGAVSADTQTLIEGFGATAPKNGFIADGSLTNPATGLKYRHWWISDHVQGICRLDPDIDTGGPFTINIGSCVSSGLAPITGSVVYVPPATQGAKGKIYIADEVANKNNLGLIRRDFNPAGGGGHGGVDTATTTLGGSGSCGVPGNRPAGMTLGPDGSLYLSFLKSPNIMKITSPAAASVPCGNFITIASVQRRNLALAFVGTTLYGHGDLSPWRIQNGSTCVSGTCAVENVFANAVALPGVGTISSNQVGASVSGTELYITDFNSITKIHDPNGIAPEMTINWAPGAGSQVGISQPSAIVADPRQANNPDVYVADDPTAGASVGQGKFYKVLANVTPAAPGAPTSVTASPSDSAALVNWTPGSDGSKPTKSYTVHVLDPISNTEWATQTTAVGIPAPTSLLVTGLTNGIPYAFSVSATNDVGPGAPSAVSGIVTPQQANPPSAPLNLSAIAGNSVAGLSWGIPLSDGGAPIQSYLVTYHNGGPADTLSVPANITGVTLDGLANGTDYNFHVQAVNLRGLGDTSNEAFATPTGPGSVLDIALGAAGPAEVISGTSAVYTFTVTNTGGFTIPKAVLDVTLPSGGFGGETLVSTRGTCLPAVSTTQTCNLGPMNHGDQAIITLTLTNVTAAVSVTATASSHQLDDTLMTDANVGDNTATVLTTITVLPPPPPASTDLNLNSGSVKGNTRNQAMTYTFGMKNGNNPATGVVFTLPIPSSYTYSSAVVNGDATKCILVTAGNGSRTVSCNVGDMAAGAQQSVVISVVPTLAGSISVTATAQQAGYPSSDPNTANNVRTVSVTVK